MPAAPRSRSGIEKTLRHLELTVTRRLDGLLRGSFPSNAPGPGSEFGTAREYTVGDDVRRMDWSVTARTQTPHVRDSIAERELETWILADGGARLDTGQAHGTKRELSLSAAAAIAHLVNEPGNRIGLLTGGVVIPPGSGDNHVRRLLEDFATENIETDLAALLTQVAMHPGRAGLVVVISDFLGPLTWSQPLRVAGQRADLLAVELIDPADEELPGDGPVRLQDPVTGEVADIVVDEAARTDYAQAAAEHRAAVGQALRSAAARRVTLRTDRDWVLDLARQLRPGNRR